MIRRMSFLTFLLLVVVSAAPSYGVDAYLYDEIVVGEVDVGRFTTTGEVAFLRGVAKFSETDLGPAPAPYPQIQLWEPDYENTGASNAQVDGIWFINLGQHWVKNRLALVLWKIVIPNANSRMTSEFAEDLTISLWVDWDQGDMWDKDELMLRDHLNISHLLPTEDETLCVYYLTAFRVPDVTQMESSKKWQNPNLDIRFYWVRGTLAYDDPDVSPDGNQLFGEAEDYRVSYLVANTKKQKQQ
jgi:hypothetical protein